MILDAKYNYRLTQLSAIVKITNILQPIINQNIDEYVTLCRRFGNKEEHPKIDYLLGEERNLRLHAEDVYWKINERTLEVRIPLDAFTNIRSHYSRIRAAISDLIRIPVKFPTWSELAKETLTDGCRPLCQGVFYNNDKSQKNKSYIHIFFDEDIARLLVNPCYGYSRLLQATVDNCRSIYTARIYMQICRHADGKKWAIPYPDLRLLLNVDSPKKKGSTESKQRIRANSVPRYHEFRRRVLDVARDELLLMVQNNTTNYYFTYTEEFPSNRHSTPSHIIFNIYETHPSKKRSLRLREPSFPDAALCWAYFKNRARQIQSGIQKYNPKKLHIRVSKTSRSMDLHGRSRRQDQ
ncbi:MAG: RepB family plasmid replication initiator protein [Alistipes finegoldii]